MIITTEKAVHDFEDVKHYERMGLEEEPPTKLVLFQFHIRDVKSLTELPDQENGPMTLIQFYDTEVAPITTPFEEVAQVYKEYNTSEQSNCCNRV